MDLARRFLEPRCPAQRQYEALRAFFVEGLSSAQAARRFGYTPGSFRVLCHQFRQDPDRDFFRPSKPGPTHAPKRDPLRQRVIALRKQNLSIYDIARILEHEGTPLSAVAVGAILKQAGFARLPRRRDEERPQRPRPIRAAVADARALDLSPRTFHTAFGGLFLFLPRLARLPLATMLQAAGLPGTQQIPALQAWLSLLGLKLFGTARHSHVMSHVLDEGLALFAGLNVIPKRSFLSEYSCRIAPRSYPGLMRAWGQAVRAEGLPEGDSFDLDFHTIPFHGEDALVEKHYISKRSRRQKGLLAFVAQDAQHRTFCYVNANLRQHQRATEILRFVEYWRAHHGGPPAELVFDSQLTTHACLGELEKQGIAFITLRRRSRNLLARIYAQPLSAWRRITLAGVNRLYRTPRILEERVKAPQYPGELRQLMVADLGHEEPTILWTNQLAATPAQLLERYARRMLIENSLADAIDFFHMDALSSGVALKVNCDLLLTLMASGLYRLLGREVGQGYEAAKARHIFRDLVQASAQITVGAEEVEVKFQKRAHQALLLATSLPQTAEPIPWLGQKRLRLRFP